MADVNPQTGHKTVYLLAYFQKSNCAQEPDEYISCSSFLADRFYIGFGDGKTKAQSSVYLTYPVSAGITVTNSPGFSPDSAADAQGAGRSVLLLT